MSYVTLSAEEVRKAVEGYDDVLSGETKKLEAFYRQFKCERCGGKFHKEFSARHVFSQEGSLIGRALLRCAGCRSLFDPFSGLWIEMGNPARVPNDIPIIKPSAE